MGGTKVLANFLILPKLMKYARTLTHPIAVLRTAVHLLNTLSSCLTVLPTLSVKNPTCCDDFIWNILEYENYYA